MCYLSLSPFFSYLKANSGLDAGERLIIPNNSNIFFHENSINSGDVLGGERDSSNGETKSNLRSLNI